MLITIFVNTNGAGEDRDVLQEIEDQAIRQVIATAPTVTEAAARLGLHRQALQRKLRGLGIAPRG